MVRSFWTNELRKIRTSTLGRNAGWMLVGQGLSFILQAGYFILLARLLGVREYGIFAGAFAFSAIATPYSSLGSGLLFVRYVGTQQENFATYWGNILFSTSLAGAGLTAVLYLVAPRVLNSASASIILPVGIANCVFAQMVNNMGFVFQTYERLQMTAALNVLTNGLRFFAVGALTLALHSASAQQWAEVSLLISLLAAIIGFFIVTWTFGRPQLAPGLVTAHFSEGLGYSLGWSAQSIYNDIDKTLLSHYGMNVQNGIYTMAYRIVDVASIPITALDAAALPRYVRDSTADSYPVFRLAVRLAIRASFLGVLMFACMFFAAPLIPHVLGRSFTEGIRALRWLCLLPALRGIHQLTGCALTGLGLQRFRTMAQLGAAGLNLVLNLWLIPRHGWLGAAWASLATDGSLALVTPLLLHYFSKRQPPVAGSSFGQMEL
jgi:O-antigen/teichoic acid export membrane protein